MNNYLFRKDHDGLLELKEFLHGCALLFLSKGDKKSKLEYIFDLYDTNNDGYLSFKEIKEGYKALLASLGNHNCDIICEQMAEATVKEFGSLKAPRQAKIKKCMFNLTKLKF